jgi:hypothetical protein
MAINCRSRLTSMWLFCFLFASSMAAQTQQFPAADFANLRAQYPADANSWTKAQYTEYNRQLALLMINIVWTYRHLNIPKPDVTSLLTAPRDPPNFDPDTRTISYPVSYAREMEQLGFMLGRDIWIAAWAPLPADKPITLHPYFDGHLVRAIDSSINSVSPVFDSNASLITCPDTQKGCLTTQALEALAVQLFLVAHECGHYVLGHQGARNLNQELAADKYGWDTLRDVAQSFYDDGAKDDRNNQFYDLLFAAAAEAPLWYQRQSNAWSDVLGTPSDAAEDSVIEKRIAQIDSSADDLMNGDQLVSDFMPDDFRGWTVQPVSVSFERPPQLLVISGVIVNPQDLAGGKFRLSSAVTRWIATDDQGVACQFTTGEAQVNIKYTPWVQSSLGLIADLTKTRKWCDVIAATANAQLQPRTADVAPYLNQALYHSGAGDFIDPTVTANAQDQAKANGLLRISVGVTSWGLP